jgi:hypothetical protein
VCINSFFILCIRISCYLHADQTLPTLPETYKMLSRPGLTNETSVVRKKETVLEDEEDESKKKKERRRH